MTIRAAILAALIMAVGLFGTRLSGYEVPVQRESLARFPAQIGEWKSAGEEPLEDDVLQVLGVDEYVNRTYVDRAGLPLNLYIGYYASQRQGNTIHSPQNCLPGSGWQPVEASRIELNAGGTSFPVNRYVIQKALHRQVVYYWYQGRGRIVANDYANKLWLMLDAARLHRTNGSLVRIVVPQSLQQPGAADHAASEFSRGIAPQLAAYLP
ncbi:MAG TPA: EpsI family protein [Vicinamibacterales bacterium]|nr:EpsI family protein [Vicinamibacterales bacterium]